MNSKETELEIDAQSQIKKLQKSLTRTSKIMP